MASGSGNSNGDTVLTINSGSSSIKFALYRLASPLERVLKGKFERVGLPNGKLSIAHASGKTEELALSITNHAACVRPLMQLLEKSVSVSAIRGIGHRVVHGGTQYRETQRVTNAMIDELRRLSPFVPDHLPSGLLLIETLQKEYPAVTQIACFDTAFHSTMPRVARLLPIPRPLDAKGIQRYGFHGLSYSFLMQELARLDPQAASGRVILAHLGNGASMAAVRGGECIDTSMAFTPTAGLVMSTRPGDLDPGLFTYLTRVEGFTGEQFHRMVNEQSGLLGVSGISSDMRDLVARESTDLPAAEAVALFCYQAKKHIGSYAAALGGLDTIVFAGGIGENMPLIRARICESLEFLGIKLNAPANDSGEAIISEPGRPVTVRVIRTDEELYIAQSLVTCLRLPTRS